MNPANDRNSYSHVASRKPVVFLVILVVILLGVICYLLIKPHVPPPFHHRPHSGAKDHRREQIKTAEGSVVGYIANTHLDVHAIRVETASDGLLAFDFRPHTAKAVMNAAAMHDKVRIIYTTEPNDEAIVYKLIEIQNLSTGQRINLRSLPPPPRVPPGVAPETFFIKDPVLVLDEYGGIAAIKSENRLFHFKPEHVDNILGLIKSSREVSLLAVLRDEQFGFVNIEQDKVYIVISITINHKTFLIR